MAWSLYNYIDNVPPSLHVLELLMDISKHTLD